MDLNLDNEINQPFFEWLELPDEKYHSIKCLSSHGLMKVLRSPSHFVESLKTPFKPTENMLFGQAAHLMALQPDQYSQRVMPRPKFDLRSKKGKAEFEMWSRSVQGKDIISLPEQDMRKIEGMRDVLLKNPLFMKYCTESKYIERCAFVSHDILCGDVLKAKPDMVGLDFIADYKTTIDASKKEFSKTINNYNYHLQAVTYLLVDSIIRQQQGLDNIEKKYIIIAQETSAPYSVKTYRLGTQTLDRGWDLLNLALAKWRRAREQNQYEYDLNETEIDIPLWGMSDYDDEI